MRLALAIVMVWGLCVAAATLALSGCASTPQLYNQDPLAKQILMPRDGYEGMLTNRTCKAKKGDQCTEWDVKTYDIRSEEVRKTLIDFAFSCSIGGKLFQVCEKSPGFCHQRRVKQGCGFLGMFCKTALVTAEYVPIERYQYLVHAGTECSSDRFHDVLSLGVGQ